MPRERGREIVIDSRLKMDTRMTAVPDVWPLLNWVLFSFRYFKGIYSLHIHLMIEEKPVYEHNHILPVLCLHVNISS